MKGKKVWKMIGVPEELKNLVDRIAKRERMKKYEVVETAITQFAMAQTYKRRGKEYLAGYTIDRAFWYMFKLANSVAQLKMAVELELSESEVKQYYDSTMKTIEQIEERLNVELDDLRRAIENYVKKPNNTSKVKVNDETKFAMMRILSKELIKA